jgi:hypothetical protein
MDMGWLIIFPAEKEKAMASNDFDCGHSQIIPLGFNHLSQLKPYPLFKRQRIKPKIFLCVFITEILIFIQLQDLLRFDGEQEFTSL